MSNVTVTKSVATDFNGVTPNISKLQTEINASPAITPTCLYINMFGDTVQIVFDADLSSDDQTALSAVIAAHDPTPIVVYATSLSIPLNTTSTRNDTYTKVGQAVFPGGSEMRVKGSGYKEDGMTSYSIKIYDLTHNTVLSEQTFDNLNEDIIDLGICDNVPVDTSIISVFVKRNGGVATDRAFVTSLFMYYN